jgi:hypothetical protein
MLDPHSSAELEEFFTEIAFQPGMDNNALWRCSFGGACSISTNLFLTGTMDIACFDWWRITLQYNRNPVVRKIDRSSSCPVSAYVSAAEKSSSGLRAQRTGCI